MNNDDNKNNELESIVLGNNTQAIDNINKINNNQINNLNNNNNNNILTESNVNSNINQQQTCSNCGTKLESTWKYCPQCNSTINENINDKEKKKENIYIILYFVFKGLVYLLRNDFSYIFYLMSLITIITGKIKCSDNKMIKIFFYLEIFGIISAIIWVIFLLVACKYIGTKYCSSNGCG